MPLEFGGGVVNDTLGHWMPDISQCGYLAFGAPEALRVDCDGSPADGLMSSRGKV
jgi:hypothetical protein